MKAELASSIWSLPGARNFVHKTGQSLRDGISLIGLFLRQSEAGYFQEQLLFHLEQELFLDVRSIDLRHMNGKTPFEVLQQLPSKKGAYQYLEQMVSDPDLPEVVLVTHFEDCSQHEIQNWVQSLARWAEACRSTSAHNSIALLLPFERLEGIPLPATDVRLSYSIWLGAPSVLDLRMLCRYLGEETDAGAQWREYFIASLSGNDLLLAEILWDYACEPVDRILEVLEKFALDRKWSGDKIRREFNQWRPIPAGQQFSFKFKSNDFNLLSRGWTVYTPEYGEEIHPAVLMLIGREEEVIHRIWRAQAALMLPMIDDIRRRICNYLTERKGSGWAVIDKKPLDTPLEMGQLKVWIDQQPSTSWEKKQWGSGVNHIWFARNELAHYKPVSYTTFLNVWRLNTSVHGMLYR